MKSDARLVAAIVASAFFMQMLDSTIINTSLPQMANSFRVRPLDLSIGITVYMMTAAAFVPVSGWLADRYGSRNVFIWAIALFTVSSLACGLGQNLTQFTWARAVQGVGGALMTPVGRIVVLRNTEKSDLLLATALITWPSLVAPVIAPVLGGFITTYSTWRWNFLLNVPLGIVGIALVARFIPNWRDDHFKSLDRGGFLLSGTALLALLYGLDQFTQVRTEWLGPSLWVAAGVVLGLLSVRHFLRIPHPLLDLTALNIQTFTVSTATSGAIFRTAINATPFLLPLLFQVGFGLNALQSGTLVLAYFLGNLAIKPLTTPTLRFFGFRRVLIINGLVAGVSIALCGMFTPETSRAWIMGVLLLAGLTRSMQFTCLNTLMFADITAAQRSSSATLSSMLQQIVSVLGVAYGAFLLNVSLMVHQRRSETLFDFKLAFWLVGLTAFLSAVAFLRLPPDAGAEVSGHGLNARSAS